MPKILFLGFTNDRYVEIKKVKDIQHYGNISRFDSNFEVETKDSKNLSSDGILKIIHLELDNWYDSTTENFKNLADRCK